MIFYNTLNRREEEFSAMSPGKVSMYTCGPTVYDYAHIGNFRAYMFEDLLRRVIEASGYAVTHVMNITDIDDKTILRAGEKGLSLKAFTDHYIHEFHEDVKTLGILPAHHYPRATEFIEQMINLIKKLIDRGFAYESDDGSVFFKVSAFKDYGRLANLNPEELRVGERVLNDEYEKEEVRDFALWKGAKKSEGDVHWDSPWGRGRPGWHIECSVMSMHYLGNHFDIHCGGVDNIFPHHENEIAQSTCATGEKFVNYWLHNEHLLVDGQKMSKSAGNFYTLRELLDRELSPEALRWSLLSTHYRQKLNFTLDKVRDAQKCINRLRELKRRLSQVTSDTGEEIAKRNARVWQEFLAALGEDLNISGAMGIMFTWVNEMFSLLDENRISAAGAADAAETLDKLDSILAVIEPRESADISDDIDKLIQERIEARKSKNWARADEIRDELDSRNIILEDTPEGTIWKRKT